jgi:hypothetical protein
MKQTQVYAVGILLILGCGSKPPVVKPGGAGDKPSSQTARICGDAVDPGAPAAPPPTPGAEPCPEITKAAVDDCATHGHFFIEASGLCTETCGPQFTVEGNSCVGELATSGPTCHDPTPYRRCTASNYCYCSAT